MIVPSLAIAQWDLDLDLSGRSYPLGGSVNLESGYGLPLWGEASSKNSASKNPWYGYIRPSLALSSAGSWNSGALQLSVFPVSILGVTTHAEALHNSSDYADYPCESHNCKGWFYRNYLEAQLALGAGPFFLLGRARAEDYSQEDETNGSFIDPLSGLVLRAEGEKIQVLTSVLGFSLHDQWQIAAINTHAINEEETQFTRMSLLTLRFQEGPWSLALGGGVYDSSSEDFHLTGVLSLGYVVRPSIELF